MLAQRLLEMMPDLGESVTVSFRASLPNWEGRAMAHIIIALKLLFGLDDATEHRNSRVARRFNKYSTTSYLNVFQVCFVW